MKRFTNTKVLLRAIGVVAAVAIVVSGVTFATLQSQQAKLTGNTIETAAANIQLSQTGATYTNTIPGYDFAGLVPGGSAVPTSGYTFFVKNSGNARLQLKLSVSSLPGNPDNIDLAKVNVLLTPIGGSAQTFTLQSLIDADATGGVTVTAPAALFPGNSQQYALQISMAADAMTGSSARLTGIDFAFTGVALTS